MHSLDECIWPLYPELMHSSKEDFRSFDRINGLMVRIYYAIIEDSHSKRMQLKREDLITKPSPDFTGPNLASIYAPTDGDAPGSVIFHIFFEKLSLINKQISSPVEIPSLVFQI